MTQVTREAVVQTEVTLRRLWKLHPDEQRKYAEEAAALLLSLQAELGEARKDAERYRWLRVERSRLTHAYTEGFRLWVQGDVTPAESLDAAIDAARESARGSEQLDLTKPVPTKAGG